jgi:hypothetical protein
MQMYAINIFKLNGEKYIEVSRRIRGISWIKVISNTELWETAGEKPVMLHYYIEKMAIDRSYCEEQG